MPESCPCACTLHAAASVLVRLRPTSFLWNTSRARVSRRAFGLFAFGFGFARRLVREGRTCRVRGATAHIVSCLDFLVSIIRPINEAERTGFGASLSAWAQLPY